MKLPELKRFHKLLPFYSGEVRIYKRIQKTLCKAIEKIMSIDDTKKKNVLD